MATATLAFASQRTIARYAYRPLCGQCRARNVSGLQISTRSKAYSTSQRPPFGQRLRTQWNATRIEWYTMPVGLGIAYLGFRQYRRVRSRDDEQSYLESGGSLEDIQIKGPWSVYVLSTLPLRSISRIWGRLNEYSLPVWLRSPIYKSYTWAFGCDLSEAEEQDLKKYPNLAAFFYRSLKPGIRPVDEKAELVSPADGRCLHFGEIHGRRVDSIKGLSYSLDALFGRESPTPSTPATPVSETTTPNDHNKVSDREFADVNGIKYSLDSLIGKETSEKTPSSVGKEGATEDASVEDKRSVVQMVKDGAEHLMGTFGSIFGRGGQEATVAPENGLFYNVVYLAPGDYHRFHSPSNWIVEMRRHFAGELFSVSPWMADRLANLFVLNERVVLLGRWKYGFFSMTPVGATNVGSIKINFDKALRTNTRERRMRAGTFTEVTYANASTILGGQPLRAGDECGGFSLGSTIVMVFEAPKDKWKWDVTEGQQVKVGQALGHVEEPSTIGTGTPV